MTSPSSVTRVRGCKVVCCLDCGLTYTNPRPSGDTIGRFYVDYEPYRECGLPAGDIARAPRSFRKPPFWKPYHPQKHGWPLIGRGRLLDFGCGAGAFLERMNRQGWQVTGMDASPEMVAEIRTKLHFRALVGTLPHPELLPESFDAISMWHALEHVHQPLETLRDAWRLLSPGGKLVIGVPNVQQPRGVGLVQPGMAGACRIISLTSPRGRCRKWSAGQAFRSSG